MRKVMLLATSAFAIFGVLILLLAETEHDRLVALCLLAINGPCVPFSLIKLRDTAIRKRGDALDRPETTRVFRRSLHEIAARIFMFVGLGTGCYLLLMTDAAKEIMPLAAWVGVVACGFGSLAVSIVLVLRPARLILSPQGLDYTYFKVGAIEWPDIIGVSVRQFMKIDFVSLELADPEKYFARGFPKRGRKTGWLSGAFSSPFVFGPNHFGANTEAVIEAIKLRLSAFGEMGSAPATGSVHGERREPHL